MLSTYVGLKKIKALPAMRHTFTQIIQNAPERRVSIVVPFAMSDGGEGINFAQARANAGFNPELPFDHTTEQGFKVIYEDGYESWSPKDVFEKAYGNISCFRLDFSQALFLLKLGYNVARWPWRSDGGNTCIALRKGYVGINLNDDTCTAFKLPKGTVADVAHYIQMRSGDVLSNWSPTTEDILAEDWGAILGGPGEEDEE